MDHIKDFMSGPYVLTGVLLVVISLSEVRDPRRRKGRSCKNNAVMSCCAPTVCQAPGSWGGGMCGSEVWVWCGYQP